ncbi:hypothetical protein [Eisenibacter elegans]|uniref:hypothetical protein n=1 Tax=Eisenibacter elegans TaxID=997 RepID=UPI0003F9AEFB|nr:hypothetical protein [Eisenibacter elegans]
MRQTFNFLSILACLWVLFWVFLGVFELGVSPEALDHLPRSLALLGWAGLSILVLVLCLWNIGRPRVLVGWLLVPCAGLWAWLSGEALQLWSQWSSWALVAGWVWLWLVLLLLSLTTIYQAHKPKVPEF